MVTAPASAYDEVPYEDGCYPFMQPDHLATLAAIHGLPDPPLDGCRLLELGCARGGNLLPMALELPGAAFVGVDLSARQVDDARGRAAALGLGNVAFHAMSLADVGAAFGEFDYVVCHGVYSWVPEPVRERILEVCSRNLTPDGLACVSYNTWPGWSARGMVRDLLRFHARREATAAGRVDRTRGFLPELVSILPNPSSPYAGILRAEGRQVAEATDTWLVHEVFEDENRPSSVEEFLGRARAAGLEFVAEAETPGLYAGLPDAARAAIGRWADDVPSREQYLDVVVNRAFRKTVLRRSDGRGPFVPSADALPRLSVRSTLEPASLVADPAAEGPLELHDPVGGGSVTTYSPLVKAALMELFDARPRAVAFEALQEGVRRRLGGGGRGPSRSDAEDRSGLGESLLRLYLSGLVDLHLRPPRLAATVPERPVASPLARLQAAERPVVTNLLRRRIGLDELNRAVLVLLDGSRTAGDVLDAIVARVAAGELELRDGSRAVRDEPEARAALAGAIEPVLRRLAGAGLLAA